MTVDCRDAPSVAGLTRAAFLRRASAAALAIGLPAFASAQAHAAGIRSTHSLTRSRFTPYVGTAFHITPPDGRSVRVELVAIDDIVGGRDREHAFSLLFRGHGRRALEQGTYTLWHPALGALRLLVVPILTLRGAQRYEIIVSRRVS